MVRVDPSFLLGMLPLVGGIGFSVAFVCPGFRTVTGAFATAKILDYSIRYVLLEHRTAVLLCLLLYPYGELCVYRLVRSLWMWL